MWIFLSLGIFYHSSFIRSILSQGLKTEINLNSDCHLLLSPTGFYGNLIW